LKKLRQYVRILNLKWQIDMGIGDVDGPQIISSRVGKSHVITLPRLYEDPNQFTIDAVEKLILAHFAETYDPIFSTVSFDPLINWRSNLRRINQEMMINAMNLVDVWSGDKLYDINKELLVIRIRNLHQMLSSIPIENIRHILSPVMLEYASVLAVSIRQEMTPEKNLLEEIFPEISKGLGIHSSTTRALADSWSLLPPLPQSKAEAISLLQHSVEESIQILNYGIKPILIERNNHWVWSLD
jgi:hypothetical protein